jgi:tetratricopeptide (TPR) repeat protein
MPPARRQQVGPLEDDERAMLEAQTRRNLDGMDLEQAGQIDEAVALYEQNVAEGFVGDWPYSRLVAHYERARRYDEALRVLARAIEVARADRRRPAADRRGVLQALQGRARLLKKTAQHAKRAGTGNGRSFITLPVIDSA